MCGIFGYVHWGVERTRAEVAEVLLNGLRRLEYRGYDSAGIAVDGPGGASCVVRSPGKVAVLQAQVKHRLGRGLEGAKPLEAHCGIAHTRWATHGPPSVENSHPHTSGPDNAFLVVHNGIITNYRSLKQLLERSGAVFESDTDTEVIPKLAAYMHERLSHSGAPPSFTELVQTVTRELEGAYALVFKSTHYPGEIVACKKGSPLILGIKAGPAAGAAEFFLSSDGSAIVEHTKNCVVLENDEMVHIAGAEYSVFRVSEHQLRRTDAAVMQLEIEVEQIMKGEYDHFMLKEIHEQPESLVQTMQGRLLASAPHLGTPVSMPSAQLSPRRPGSASPSPTLPLRSIDSSFYAEGHRDGREFKVVLGGLMDHLAEIRRSRRLIFIACGSSFHSCMAARQTVEELTQIPVSLELASDLLDREAPFFRDDTCLFVSQSGETADTLRALEFCKARGTLCVGVTNTVGSSISRETHCGVHINAGCEIGVASTKAYTSQVLVIIMIALVMSDDLISKQELRQRIMRDMSALPLMIKEVLQQEDCIKALAAELKDQSSLLVFGRGYNYATAMETALKVKEIALMHSEGINAGEMKHGPLALVDETMPIIVIATQDKTHTKMFSTIEQLRARQGRLVAVVNDDDEEVEQHLDPGLSIIKVPHAVDCLQPIINVLPMQLLSYHLAVLRGHNVDQPRNLAKSVTVE